MMKKGERKRKMDKEIKKRKKCLKYTLEEKRREK